MASDSELLAEFVRRRSDSAFGQIVGRYSNLVFAAARRQVGDPHLAEDVTQATFLVLARRAASVPGDRLPAWLLTTTRLCARDAIKKQTRRSHYEREAAMQRSELSQPGEMPDPKIAELLDESLTKLRARDCTALAMRYLQDKPLDDVAAALGVSLNAAQKIIARSLAKLRKILTRRGVVLSSTGILATALLHETATAAPAGLVISASSSTGLGLSIAKGVSNMMFWTKVKIVTTIAAAITLLGGAGSMLMIHALADTPTAVSDAIPAPPAQPTNEPASVAPFDSPFLELVGCRIKQSVSLNLTAGQTAPKQVSWVEQQYSQVQWTIDPTLATNVTGYTITITPSQNPTGAQTIQADKSATAQVLAEQLAQPGEYDLKISAWVLMRRRRHTSRSLRCRSPRS